ncbi:MAG TPA: 2-hydroxyacid dehydrogenase [Syntrophales bacterium]|nr:2-hydroxyacid dehydrogenase [Syntrophales bacterium]HRT27250.1 2-hydroxyacid dehydrogenase [Syntrophales bacterium]HRT71597.1 2-hydroxyacid dehydrogenase [Syntrophales bacterium]
MKILFAAHEDAWGGVLGMLRKELPEHEFVPTGRFGFDSLRGFDVLIPTMTVVSKAHLVEADRLRLIQQSGVGLEGVDIEAAKSLNIRVANVPADISGNADSVAELGIYLMLGLSRNVRQIPESFANGLMGYPRGRALRGKTVGIIGLGGIGRALAKRLKPFGVRLVGIKRQDPQKAKEELGLEWTGTPAELDELLNMSDYVVLCLPVTDESRNMLNRRSFRAMKRDAFLINLSRGGLVDRDALEEALSTGTIAGAGLDVFWKEPVDPNDPIFKHNVLATPHIGGATDVSIQGIMREVAENIRRLDRGQEPLYQM